MTITVPVIELGSVALPAMSIIETVNAGALIVMQCEAVLDPVRPPTGRRNELGGNLDRISGNEFELKAVEVKQSPQFIVISHPRDRSTRTVRWCRQPCVAAGSGRRPNPVASGTKTA